MTSDRYDWLLKEYEQMFNEKRHYDGRFFSLLSFFMAFVTICVSVVVGVNDIIKDTSVSIFPVFFCMVGAVGFIILVNMYYSRVNYVKVCRQINSIRQFCLVNQIPSFERENKMYLNPEFPHFYMLNSMHLIVMHFLVLINSFFIGLSFLFITEFRLWNAAVSIIIFLLLSSVQTLVLRSSLKKRDIQETLTTRF